jgi:hypothetical protein
LILLGCRCPKVWTGDLSLVIVFKEKVPKTLLLLRPKF